MDDDSLIDALAELDTEQVYREALERIVVCCDNGALAERKLEFIRHVAAAALGRER